MIRRGHIGHILDISTYGRTGEDTCRACSGNPQSETSNSTLDPWAQRGRCADADDPSVESRRRGAVSVLKALEFQPGRTQAQPSGILAHGGQWLERLSWGDPVVRMKYRTGAMSTRSGRR